MTSCACGEPIIMDREARKSMARPVKQRHVAGIPATTQFIPTTQPVMDLPENVLKMEELEALRLKDLEGYEQSACAEQMGISRPTFHRILRNAHEKVADSLLHGKAIRIEGGDFLPIGMDGHCPRCGRTWDVPVREAVGQQTAASDNGSVPTICPECAEDTRGLSAVGKRRRGHGKGGADPLR